MEIEQELAQARRWLKDITSVHAAAWGLGDEESWAFDQETGVLDWSFENGTTVFADAQIVGTFVSGVSQWLWACDNVSIEKKYAKCASAARRLGKKHAVDVLTNPSSLCTMKRAWDLAAFAARNFKSQGVYRGKYEKTSVFFAFGDVTIKSKKKKRAK